MHAHSQNYIKFKIKLKKHPRLVDELLPPQAKYSFRANFIVLQSWETPYLLIQNI
jgi:hypothetical protein